MDLKEVKEAIIIPAINKIRNCIIEDDDIEKAQEFISLLHQQLEDLNKGLPVITAYQVNNWACNLRVGDLITDDKNYTGAFIYKNELGLSIDSIYKILDVKEFLRPTNLLLSYEIIKSRDGQEGKKTVIIPTNSTRFKRIKFIEDVKTGFNS